MSWSLEYTLSATCVGGSVAPTTLASATRPYVPEAIRPSTRNFHRPSNRIGPPGPTISTSLSMSSRDSGGDKAHGALDPRGIAGAYVHELTIPHPPSPSR